jgi:hypothetical protein
MITHSYTYESTLADALRVGWRVDDIIGGEKALDFSRNFLPDSLAGVSGLTFLSADEQRTLNQIRGNSYLYLFGFVEEFILPFVLDQARSTVHGASAETRALVRFADEEAKHIDLFRRFAQAFESGFPTKCGVIGPASDAAAAILGHSKLGVALVILHLEWMTQRHYVESVKGNETDNLDPLFCDMLRFHWLEEAQHARLDTLLVARLAVEGGSAAIQKAFDDYLAIATMLDGALAAQVQLDIASLSEATGRTFTDDERAAITAAQQRSYRWTFLVSGATHPNFVRALQELSPARADQIATVAAALAG